MATILIKSAKLSTPGRLKIRIFRNKGYDVIIFDYDVISKLDSNYIVDGVM